MAVVVTTRLTKIITPTAVFRKAFLKQSNKILNKPQVDFTELFSSFCDEYRNFGLAGLGGPFDMADDAFFASVSGLGFFKWLVSNLCPAPIS